MTVLLVLPQHHVLVFDGTDLATRVGPDLRAAHVQSDDEETQRHLGPHVQGAEGLLQGPDVAEDDHEELEQRHGHDDKVDGSGVHLLVDPAPSVDEGEVVSVHQVLEDEVEETEGCDEGTGEGEHDHHGEDQHHPGVLLPEPELVLDRLPDSWSVRLAARPADLNEIPEQLRESDQLQT